jgi:hypothetical protein
MRRIELQRHRQLHLPGQCRRRNSALGTVTLTVTTGNDAPVAMPAATTTLNGAVIVDVLLNDSDPDGGAQSCAVDNPSVNGGTVWMTTTTVIYTTARSPAPTARVCGGDPQGGLGTGDDGHGAASPGAAM